MHSTSTVNTSLFEAKQQQATDSFCLAEQKKSVKMLSPTALQLYLYMLESLGTFINASRERFP